MLEKLVISGLPGSSKSALAKHIIEYVKSYPHGLRAEHVSDYAILYQKFLDEEAREVPESDRRLHRVDHGGFYVSDPKVYDEALIELGDKIRAISTQETDLVLVEFARSNYLPALQLLGKDFLRDSSFIFLNTDINICKERVCKRIKRSSPPRTLDDHFVSEHTFEFYTGQDNQQYWESLRDNLESEYSIDSERITIIPNNGSWENVVEVINSQIDNLYLLTTSSSRYYRYNSCAASN